MLPDMQILWGLALYFKPQNTTHTMIITVENVNKLGKLARIAIAPDAAPELANQLSSILGLIETMQAVNTEGVAPLAHPTAFVADVALRLREDMISEPNDEAGRDARMVNAPASEAGYFLVPRVIE
jgi:aspartyl-tRNA(Asn)/glutamyl-tRNA(Gln) amidotransferase subunit C